MAALLAESRRTVLHVYKRAAARQRRWQKSGDRPCPCPCPVTTQSCCLTCIFTSLAIRHRTQSSAAVCPAPIRCWVPLVGTLQNRDPTPYTHVDAAPCPCPCPVTAEPRLLTFFFTSWTTEPCCSVSGSHPVGTLQQATSNTVTPLGTQSNPASILLVFDSCALLLVSGDE